MTTSSDTLILEAGMGRSASATTGGIAAVVLSILGLASVYPTFMLAVSTIAIGVALLFKGAALAAEYNEILARIDSGTLKHAEVSGGMSAELLAGGAGIVLGILGLLGVDTTILTAVAVIAFGSALVMSSGVTQRLNHLKIASSGAEDMAQRIAEEATSASVGAQVLVGLSAAVLGILSLIGMVPVTLALIGLLSIGAVSLLTGSAVGAKMVHMFRS
jgi:hypothetical protein